MAVVNRAAVNMGVQVSLLYVDFDSWHTPGIATTKSYGASSFCVFKETPYGYPYRLNPFTFPPTVHRVLASPDPTVPSCSAFTW